MTGTPAKLTRDRDERMHSPVSLPLTHRLGLDLDEVRERTEAAVADGATTKRELGDLPYTSRAKASLEVAMTEASALGHTHVGSEHLLLGVMADGKSVAAQVLHRLGATVEDARAIVRGESRRRAAFKVRIDDKSDKLIYEQIVAQVQEAIATGELRPGDRLPAVRQLADDLGIAPGTVSRAYGILEESGAVKTEGARGTFVAPRASAATTSDDRSVAVRALLRQVVVAAFHLGASGEELRRGLEEAMKDIYGTLDAA